MKKHEHPAISENHENEKAPETYCDKPPKAPVARRKRRGKRHVLVMVSILAFILIAATSLAIWYYYPGTRQSDAGMSNVIYSDTPLAAKDYRFDNGSLLLSFDFIKKNLDPSIYWESAINKIIVTTAEKVIEMKTGQLTAYVNSNPVSIDIPVTVYGGMAFIPVDFLSPIYKISINRLSSGVTVITDLKKPVLVMTLRVKSYFSEIPFLYKIRIPEDSPYLRERPTFRSPWLKKLSTGDELVVTGEENNWYKVRTGEGRTGFIRKSHVVFKEIIPPSAIVEKPRVPWKPLGGKINLTWDYMSKPKTDMSAYKPIPGLNVISPTWFAMTDGDGSIKNIASLPYMDWARREGLQVWALFSNSFDPEITTTMLRSFETRKKVINQLLVFSELYDFSGINIDFENIDVGDKDYFSQFIRELVPYMHEQDLTVSIDVTVRSTNPNWSMCYDREAIGKAVDYMAVMTYDEHWSTSPEAGSVASLPWVRNGIERIIEQVPAEKLLLGVPFYARLWKETPGSDGTVKTSSVAITMPACANLLKNKNLKAALDTLSGQNYCSYIENGFTYKIWLEDEFSMRQRIRLVKEYGLSGVASWRKGFDTTGIWDVIKDELQRFR